MESKTGSCTIGALLPHRDAEGNADTFDVLIHFEADNYQRGYKGDMIDPPEAEHFEDIEFVGVEIDPSEIDDAAPVDAALQRAAEKWLIDHDDEVQEIALQSRREDV